MDNKVRVYELAKELNTTSKRLMEKLAEINVHVKNHMSLLEDKELEVLYKHIGIQKRPDIKGDGSTAQEVKPVVKPEVKKDNKNAPRIIRKTEIYIDSKKDNRDAGGFPEIRTDQKSDYRSGNLSSGLRPGFIRKEQSIEKRRNVSQQKNDIPVQHAGTTEKTEIKDSKQVKRDVSELSNLETRPEQNIVKKPEHKTATKAEHKVDAKTNAGLHQYVKSPREEMKAESEKSHEPIAEKAAEKIAAKPLEDEALKANTESKLAKEGEESAVSQLSEQKNLNEAQGSRRQSHEQYHKQDNRQQSQGIAQRQDNRQQSDNFGRQDSRPEQYQQNQGYQKRQDRRPQGEGFQQRQDNRPSGDGFQRRQDNRLSGDGYQRRQDNRPQGEGFQQRQDNRPSGDGFQQRQDNRPQGEGFQQRQDNRPYGDVFQRRQDNRPQGEGFQQRQDNRPYGDGYQRRQDNRPQGEGFQQRQDNRPYGDGYQRRQDNRPQGEGFQQRQDNRPSGDGFQRRQDNRPGQYQQGQQGQRYNNDRRSDNRQQRSQNRSGFLDIPKPELTVAQKEEMTNRGKEERREFVNKEADKDIKRDQKREVVKTPAVNKGNKFKAPKAILTEKKISTALDNDEMLDEIYSEDAALKKAAKKTSRRKQDVTGQERKHIPHKAILTEVTLNESMSVKELAEALKKTSTEVIKKLFTYGIMATLNQEIDFDTAALVAEEFAVKAQKAVTVNEEDILFNDQEDREENLQPRPPVVVVMGHVDHGKTSLLDAIREANVTASEAGGITQHIGAYMVKINNRNITFLDTPGHEAFTAMRARGAQITDIAILVVAADDGVMPQTVEAINHAKAANVPIIVAINKIDKPGANPERVKQELTEYNLVSEEWGGDTIMAPVSAKQRINIDHLLEMILLLADIKEMKANPDRQAKGTVIEAKLDKGKGPVATVLVQRGTLNVGDSLVTGTVVGRIRAMLDDKGQKVKKAKPSTPVEIHGLQEVPEAGEVFYAITDERVAKQLAEKRKQKKREEHLKADSRISLEDLFNQIKEGKVKDLNLIVKADVQGSVEAVKQSLEKLSNDEVKVRIIHGGVGAITESDVTLAQVSNAIIIGFNIRPAPNVTEIAQNNNVEIKLYRVIYNAIEDIQAAMKGMLEPTFKENILGHAEIRQIFKVSGIGTIGGCYVTDGKIARNSEVRIVRNGIVVHEGKLASLKRFKDDAREVAQGFECGMGMEKFNDIKEGDIIESFVMEEVAR